MNYKVNQSVFSTHIKKEHVDFPGGPVVKNLPAKAEHMGSIPDPGGFHMPQGN